MRKMLFISIIVMLELIGLNAQSTKREFSPYSVEAEAGLINSFVGFSKYELDWCGPAPCFPNFGGYFEKVQNLYFSLKFNFKIDKNNQFGFGSAFSQYGNTSVTYWPLSEYYDSHEEKINCLVMKQSHKVTFLHGHLLTMGFDNELQFEFLLRNRSNGFLNLFNLSHLGGLFIGCEVSERTSFSLKMIARTALTKYNRYAFDGPFHRFGTGLLFGMEYRLGKFKYHSPEKQ